jgi:two-component system sensor histidine kinase/response regulator
MSEQLRILVVDDEPGMRSGVARALRDFTVCAKDVNGDYSLVVDQADSGEQALEMLQPNLQAGDTTASGELPAGYIDIILLDHKLPGMTGLDVLDTVIAKTRNVAVVMITAYASLETAVSAIKRGAYDFLAKPFTPAELKNTVRKAAESLILARQARKLAYEKHQMRFQFVSVLAHELKAPLAAIEGYLHIIRDHEAGDNASAYDHMLDRSLIRLEGMRKLITDLLDLTRIESGKKKRDLADVDIVQVAHLAMETALPDALRRGITIQLQANGSIAMQADRHEIEIIFNNLLSNAVKYNRDGGRVTINLSQGDSGVVIQVVDTGIGMTGLECQRLFEDFVRIKNDQTRNISGSGLGLSIVKKLAVLYGGGVTVSSISGQGSTFTVTLSSKMPAGGQAK